MDLSPKHFFLTSSQDIQELIQPLIKHFGITSFIYKKNFNDGSEIRLSNKAAWSYHFYKGGFYAESPFESKPSSYSKVRVLWDEVYPKDSNACIHSRQHGLDHGLTFMEPFSEGCEVFAFAVPVGRVDLMHRYLAHIDLLEKFILSFKDRAQSLIKKAEQSKILIPGKFELAPTIMLGPDYFVNRKDFSKEISGEVYQNFSARELQCAKLLLQGYTAKMMAQQFNLSPRTIETYIHNIRKKTGALNRSDLIQALVTCFK